jgi:tungstate transport system substrate-binding protein
MATGMTCVRVIVPLMCAALGACTSESRGPRGPVLRLGTTYTVEQSGALAVLDSLAAPVSLRVVVGASGQILRSAAAGNLDVVLTHAPALEQRLLVAPGHAALRCPFVASRFAIVGPVTDPAHVAEAASAAEVVRRIAAARAVFISRADSSGTHAKELSLWAAAGINPAGAWYVQTGVDQAATLRLADERAGYAIVDLPTFSRQQGIELRSLFDSDTALANPYTLYVIGATPQSERGRQFVEWAMRAWRARLPGAAFTPLAGDCAAP